MMSRIKKAIKILLGKPEETKPHKYVIETTTQLKFENKNIVITGGTGAIGTAVVYKLLAYGANVIVCARNKNKLEKLVKDVGSNFEKHIFTYEMDVTNDEQIEKTIKEIIDCHGYIDVFINNAGGQPGRVGNYCDSYHLQSFENVDLVVNTNLRSTMKCTHEILKYMVKQNMGLIINLSSVIALGGKTGMCDYAASKAGIIGFTRSIALEYGKYNIRANSICPGLINQVPFDGGSDKKATSRNILGRIGYTEEIAKGICFLIEDEFVTGENIVIDGGRAIGLYGDK